MVLGLFLDRELFKKLLVNLDFGGDPLQAVDPKNDSSILELLSAALERQLRVTAAGKTQRNANSVFPRDKSSSMI